MTTKKELVEALQEFFDEEGYCIRVNGMTKDDLTNLLKWLHTHNFATEIKEEGDI